MLGKDYSVNIILNALPNSQLNWNIGGKPTYPTSFWYMSGYFSYHLGLLVYYKTMALTCFSKLFHYITLNVTFCYAGIVINASNNTSVKLKITYSFIRHIRVSNACITEFRILILLGDEWIPLFRLCLKVNIFCFISERLFTTIYQSRQSICALLSRLVAELVQRHWFAIDGYIIHSLNIHR